MGCGLTEDEGEEGAATHGEATQQKRRARAREHAEHLDRIDQLALVGGEHAEHHGRECLLIILAPRAEPDRLDYIADGLQVAVHAAEVDVVTARFEPKA